MAAWNCGILTNNKEVVAQARAFSPDCRPLIAGGHPGTGRQYRRPVKAWDVGSGREM
jgi:hypothetical protein